MNFAIDSDAELTELMGALSLHGWLVFYNMLLPMEIMSIRV